MPMKWVPPEEAYHCEARGLTVYHCYKHDDFNNRLEYWFTTDATGDEDGQFDIRDWANYDPVFSPIQNVRRATDMGAITPMGIDKESL